MVDAAVVIILVAIIVLLIDFPDLTIPKRSICPIFGAADVTYDVVELTGRFLLGELVVFWKFSLVIGNEIGR